MNKHILKSILILLVGVLLFSTCDQPTEPDTTPPTPVELYPVTYQDGSFNISWSQNNDDDFSSYTLYESTSEDMSDETLKYETDERTDTTYVVTGIGEGEIRYYKIVVEDYWGLQSESNVEIGELHNWFVKTFNVQGGGSGYSVQQTTDGGYIITGYTVAGDPDYYFPDMLLIKTDSQGNEQWIQIFGGNGEDEGFSVQQTIDGGFIITGYTDVGVYNYDVWLIKTNSQGNEEWNQTFGGNSENGGFSIQLTTDGGYIITGGNNNDVWLIKTDSQGNEEWNKTYSGKYGFSIKQTTDGGYIITGVDYSYETYSYDILLIKTDSQGNEEWTRTFGESYHDRGYSVQQTADGGYIVAGATNEDSDYGLFGDAILIKTDSQGNEEWNKTYSGNKAYSVQQTNESGYIFTGYKEIDGSECGKAWLVKTDSNGNEEWNQTFDDSGCSEGRSVQLTTDGGYIITGRDGGYVWLIKTDSEGNTAPYGD